MRISDLYRKNIELARTWRTGADLQKAALVRDHFREQAGRLEYEAMCLAHCCSQFGDQDLAAIDVLARKKDVAGWSCDGCNPWACGLSIIASHLEATVKTSEMESCPT
ncbi:MAG TPA: hypothetical protein VGH81_07535 [Rudaea sp.]|jgi:hypothetical protein